MSQLQTVLRRSVAHLDPSDHDGRERTFTNAREAMIRLLWSYDPPLTPKEIDSKIDEFDAVVASIAREGESPEAADADGDEDADEAGAPATKVSPAAAEAKASSEPGRLAVPKSEIVAAPAATSFATSLVLPPREPVRKLARFEPLSQIGSPTPGDAARTKATTWSEDGPPRPDAAVTAALAALDKAAVTDKKPAAKAEPAKTADPRGREADDEVGLLDEEIDPAEIDAPDLDAEIDDEPHDDEGPEASDEPDLDERDDEEDDADQYRPETAEEVLRLHRERFDRRDTEAAEDEHDTIDEEAVDDEPLDADEADSDDRDAAADEADEDPFDEEEPRPTLGERLRNLTDAVSGRMVAIVAGVVLLLVAGLGGAAFFLNRTPAPAATAEGAGPAATPAKPTDIAGMIAASEDDPKSPAPATAEARPAPQPAAEPAGTLALETLNLFDGRDPSVFQSMPDNPVRFEGDTQGGFARVSSSINSTGSRITVGRGVYERLSGRTIRIVVVARAASGAPSHSLRFAYQNGRSLSPWKDGVIGADYAPLSTTWTVPKDRGGPETDAVLIEPGIPGDGTAADIKSVRIEVLK
ncbi:MAG: hypothetical protein J0H21_04255 [Rhizobiales bacterium]|nr:hypothetical protein [Hyphomicrobiales bacterium]